MKLADLSPELRERIGRIRYDSIIEKHEGPMDWASEMKFGSPEFMSIDNRWVLLPVELEQHAKITILRCIVAEGAESLTLFLRDLTFGDHSLDLGFIAICDRFPGEDFYLTIVYHEWFVIQTRITS